MNIYLVFILVRFLSLKEQNYYELLEVPKNATQQQIKKSYRKLS